MPEVSRCCGSHLEVEKTRTRAVATLAIGEFVAKEHVLICRECGTRYTTGELQKIVPPLCKFGYDVLVYVGKAAFLLCRSDDQIIHELRVKNVSISPSEVAYLEKKFVVYLALAHGESSQRIRAAMQARGGYVLHLDGMCERDSLHLMSGLDEVSEIALHNVKIPSESADHVAPFLSRIQEDYGEPLAIVSDLAQGIANAITDVFPGVPHFVCHFHFLRDIGKDLLDKENDVIRNRLKKHKITSKLRKRAQTLKAIVDSNPELPAAFHADVGSGHLSNCGLEFVPVVSTYALIRWALDGKRQGGGYGYPFDRPYVTFAQRLRVLYDYLERLGDIRLRGEWRDNRPFFKARLDLKETVCDAALRDALTCIESKIEVFDKLRDAMRITVDGQHRGLNDDGNDADPETIRKGVESFRHWLVNDTCYSPDNDYGKMIAQIDQYWEKLFADPITVDTPQGKVTFQPQRTDNILERFFRDIRRNHRRKTGTTSMGKRLKAMLAQTPLVKNLENPEYLQIILNGKATLADRFSEIDARIVREELHRPQENSEGLSPKLREVINTPNLPQIVMKLFLRRAMA